MSQQKLSLLLYLRCTQWWQQRASLCGAGLELRHGRCSRYWAVQERQERRFGATVWHPRGLSSLPGRVLAAHFSAGSLARCSSGKKHDCRCNGALLRARGGGEGPVRVACGAVAAAICACAGAFLGVQRCAGCARALLPGPAT